MRQLAYANPHSLYGRWRNGHPLHKATVIQARGFRGIWYAIIPLKGTHITRSHQAAIALAAVTGAATSRIPATAADLKDRS